MLIRPETPADIATIHQITKAAFAPMPFSDGSEPEIITALRADGDLALSLVAIEEGQILGHVAFSPVTIGSTPGTWFGLGPISVAPKSQRSGIGAALIQAGHERLIGLAAAGCVLIGDPNYYSRHGYIGDGRISYMGLEDRLVQWISFAEPKPHGEIYYSRAFSAP